MSSFRLKTLWMLCLLLLAVHNLSTPAESHAQMRVSALSDIAFGTWSGSGNLQGSSPVCVYHLDSDNYLITVTGPSNQYRVSSGGNHIPFAVEWRDDSPTFTSLSSGVTSTTFSGAHRSSTTCSGSTNATIRVTLAESDLSAAIVGSYGGTLTILLEATP